MVREREKGKKVGLRRHLPVLAIEIGSGEEGGRNPEVQASHDQFQVPNFVLP